MPRTGFIGDTSTDKPAEPEMPDRSRLFNTCGVFTAICVTPVRQLTIFGRDLVIGRGAVSLVPTYENVRASSVRGFPVRAALEG
jgi:hypothetical protein